MADRKQTSDPRAEAVRLAQTSQQSRRDAVAERGVGPSTRCCWIDWQRKRELDHPPAERQEEHGRQTYSPGAGNPKMRKSMRLRIVDAVKKGSWVARLLRRFDVGQRGYFDSESRPASRR